MKRRISLACTLVCAVAALAFALCALCGCASSQVKVKVLDHSVSVTTGTGTSGVAVTSTYSYDDAGKLVGMAQSAEGDSSQVNLVNQTFTYNESNQMTEVSWYYQQYDGNIGYRETFDYTMSNTNFCTAYSTEVLSQGVGSTSTMYVLGEDGTPSQATTAIQDPSREDPIVRSSYFTYLESGHISSITSSAPGYSWDLVTALSDESKGSYVYYSGSGQTLSLTFNEDGQLTSRQLSTGDSTESTAYTYREITVDKNSFVPNIITNPQGFDNVIMPSLTKAVAEKIVGK